MTTTDPVVADPTDDELHTAAASAILAVMRPKWPDAGDDALVRVASGLLNLAIEIGPRDAVVLVQGSAQDEARLADAVRRTGTSYCADCPNPPAPYNGQPADQDRLCSRRVIEYLLRPVG